MHVWSAVLFPNYFYTFLANWSANSILLVLKNLEQSNKHAFTNNSQYCTYLLGKTNFKAIGENMVTQFHHWLAENLEKLEDILWGMHIALVMTSSLWIFCFDKIDCSVQYVIKCFAVSRNRLCMGSTAANLIGLKYGSSIRAENRTPCSLYLFLICFCTSI